MEKQEHKSRVVLFLVFLLTLISIGLLAGALGSDEWVKSTLIRDLDGGTNSLPLQTNDAVASHGLFKGKAVIQSLSAIIPSLDIKICCNFFNRICEYQAINGDGTVYPSTEIYKSNMSIDDKCRESSGATGVLYRPGELNFWMWIATWTFLSLAILCGLIAAIFTMINVIYVPISDIVGVTIVYVWNAVACICTIITLCVWSGLYYSHLRYNMLPPYYLQLKVTNCGHTEHGMAVWLCLTALLLFLINIVLIRFRKGTKHFKQRTYIQKEDEGLTLY